MNGVFAFSSLHTLPFGRVYSEIVEVSFLRKNCIFCYCVYVFRLEREIYTMEDEDAGHQESEGGSGRSASRQANLADSSSSPKTGNG